MEKVKESLWLEIRKTNTQAIDASKSEFTNRSKDSIFEGLSLFRPYSTLKVHHTVQNKSQKLLEKARRFQ